MPDKLIFSCPQMTELAVSVAKNDKAFKVGSIQWGEFQDGFPDLFIDNVKAVKGSDVYFFASFDDLAEITRQLCVIYALPRYCAGSLTVILPFFPTATMERVDEEGVIATAMSLARMLSVIPLSAHGPARVMYFDEHVQTLRGFFRDNVIPVPLSSMPLAMKVLESMDNAAVVFPDEGAKKRFGKYFVGIPHIICEKVRDGDSRVVKMTEGDAKGKNALIIDDLSRSGGTIDECRKELHRNGAASVSAFVVHATFDGYAWKRFRPDMADSFSGNFYVTDSCPAKAKVISEYNPFRVLSLSDLIYQAIKE